MPERRNPPCSIVSNDWPRGRSSLMTRALLLAVLACAPASRTVAFEAPASPPLPYPMVPPVADRPAPAAREKPKPKAKAKPSAPTIRLGEKHEADHPSGHGAGQIPPGRIQVKAVGGKLMTLLNGSASSHCFFGVPSISVESIQLVQEFEIVPGSDGDPMVEVALSGKIDGYVRSELKSSASLRVADATVYSLEGGPSVWL